MLVGKQGVMLTFKRILGKKRQASFLHLRTFFFPSVQRKWKNLFIWKAVLLMMLPSTLHQTLKS